MFDIHLQPRICTAITKVTCQADKLGDKQWATNHHNAFYHDYAVVEKYHKEPLRMLQHNMNYRLTIASSQTKNHQNDAT